MQIIQFKQISSTWIFVQLEKAKIGAISYPEGENLRRRQVLIIRLAVAHTIKKYYKILEAEGIITKNAEDSYSKTE